jgi:translocator protein
MMTFPLTDLPSSAKLAIIVIACIVAAVTGSLATTPNLPWHAGLVKPVLHPPNWLFGPAWTVLFGLMAFAAWRIWALETTQQQALALWLFAIQLVFNAAWSWAFFGLQSPLAGIVVILPFLALVLATTIAFFRLDALSGWLMAPYPLWVAFATYLNIAIWRLNPA